MSNWRICASAGDLNEQTALIMRVIVLIFTARVSGVVAIGALLLAFRAE